MSNRVISYNDLEEKMKEYLPKEEIEEVEKAYKFAAKMHKGQYRKTGEEYIVHPLFVAHILTSIRADKETLMAGLLHDVIEDTEITKETFEMAQEVSFYYCSISRDIFANTTTEKPIDTEKGYRELLSKSQDGTFNPTFLNKCGIGGCDARKNGYTEQFIDRLLEQNRCFEIFNHGGKGRKFIIIKE